MATVLCAGTKYDSRSNDIIAWLNQHAGSSHGAKLFLSGPGSGEFADELITASASRAIARSAFGKVPGVSGPANLLKSNFDLATKVAKTLDLLTGGSLFEAIDAAVSQLEAIAVDGMVINMAGWSRGAVTCVGLAYRLADHHTLSKCPINLFLFDPVPGPKLLNKWNWQEELGQLRSNIASLRVILMEHESRTLMMRPLIDPFVCSGASCGEVPGESIELFPMPGEHSSAVESGGNFTESADIGAHLVCEFLLRNGTPVPRTKLLSNVTLVESYARLKHKAGEGILGAPAARAATIPNALRRSLFFVNEHHEKMFALGFPRLAMILDPTFNAQCWGSSSLAEVPALKSHAPTMAQVIGDGISLLRSLGTLGTRATDTLDLDALLHALGYSGRIQASLMSPMSFTSEWSTTANTTTRTMPAIKFR